ncbi:MAG: hypothetical protein P0Y64_04230 [Candidatus Sphingomonas colombiensis]|nr:hypothetical protein [Sphingomonas sp.]WEK44047.1 MAG: hypothetical protein P0Y64_04230 [Sphingomonas sp.]
MTWDKSALAALAVVGLGAGIVVAGTASADTIVVRASGPSAKVYPIGRKLAGNASVALQAGDVVTLLDPKGTRTLRGPGNFSVTGASAAPTGGLALAALLDTKPVRRARTGAVRGTIADASATPPRRPNLWLVDIASAGPQCVADPANLRLWRADAAKPATVRIDGDGAQSVVTFAASEPIAVWPARLPVRDGATYRLNDGTRTTEIRFALVDGKGAATDDVASSLIAHQCNAQLDVLVETASRGRE